MRVKLTGGKVIRVNSGVLTVSYETKTVGNEPVTRYVKVWTNERFNVGDVLDIEGDGDVRLESYEKDGALKHGAYLHINRPKITADTPF